MSEAALYVGATSYKHFARSYKAWGIPCIHVGKYVRFRERDLEAYIERNTEAA